MMHLGVCPITIEQQLQEQVVAAACSVVEVPENDHHICYPSQCTMRNLRFSIYKCMDTGETHACSVFCKNSLGICQKTNVLERNIQKLGPFDNNTAMYCASTGKVHLCGNWCHRKMTVEDCGWSTCRLTGIRLERKAVHAVKDVLSLQARYKVHEKRGEWKFINGQSSWAEIRKHWLFSGKNVVLGTPRKLTTNLKNFCPLKEAAKIERVLVDTKHSPKHLIMCTVSVLLSSANFISSHIARQERHFKSVISRITSDIRKHKNTYPRPSIDVVSCMIDLGKQEAMKQRGGLKQRVVVPGSDKVGPRVVLDMAEHAFVNMVTLIQERIMAFWESVQLPMQDVIPESITAMLCLCEEGLSIPSTNIHIAKSNFLTILFPERRELQFFGVNTVRHAHVRDRGH